MKIFIATIRCWWYCLTQGMWRCERATTVHHKVDGKWKLTFIGTTKDDKVCMTFYGVYL